MVRVWNSTGLGSDKEAVAPLLFVVVVFVGGVVVATRGFLEIPTLCSNASPPIMIARSTATTRNFTFEPISRGNLEDKRFSLYRTGCSALGTVEA